MPRKQANIFYIYKTTNLLNNKYYIGKHCAIKIEDGYLGSGKHLRYSIRKHGKENFRREILEFCLDKEHLVKREEAIITQKVLLDPLCMNLRIGGQGGLSNSLEHKNKFILAGINNFNKTKDKRLSTIKEMRNNPDRLIILKQKIKDGLVIHYENNTGSFKNNKHTENSKEQISRSMKGKGLKESNSQYGTMWITNGFDNKKIKKDTLIPNGYSKGRK